MIGMDRVQFHQLDWDGLRPEWIKGRNKPHNFHLTKNQNVKQTPYNPGFLHKKYFLFSRLKLVLIFMKFEPKYYFFFGPA